MTYKPFMLVLEGVLLKVVKEFVFSFFSKNDLDKDMDVSKNRGGPPKWMVYNGKPY